MAPLCQQHSLSVPFTSICQNIQSNVVILLDTLLPSVGKVIINVYICIMSVMWGAPQPNLLHAVHSLYCCTHETALCFKKWSLVSKENRRTWVAAPTSHPGAHTQVILGTALLGRQYWGRTENFKGNFQEPLNRSWWLGLGLWCSGLILREKSHPLREKSWLPDPHKIGNSLSLVGNRATSIKTWAHESLSKC